MTSPYRTRGSRALVLIAALWGLTTTTAQGQRNPSGLPSPRVYQVAPSGAKTGSTVEITVYGLHLDDPEQLIFSHPEIKAELVAVPEPLAKKDAKSKQKQRGRGRGKGKVQSTANFAKYKVTIPPSVPVGNHELRLVGKYGVSNSRIFVVGDQTELLEIEPNNEINQAQKVSVNSTTNGNINNPTDVDYFRIDAKKGQRIVVACLTSSIDSRAQPQIEIYDQNDRQIASNRTYSEDDAVTDFTASEDGTFLIRLYQFTHLFRPQIPGGMPGGASDHFYRLSITTAPWIDAVYPNVVEPGKQTTVTVFGRNLPGGKLDPAARFEGVELEQATVTINAPADAKGKLNFSGSILPASGWQDGVEVRVKNASGSSNPFLVGLARAPVVLESASNDSLQSAQQVPFPCEIVGRVEKRRDRDWFTFAAKKNEPVNVEVFSNRLGAPTYAMVVLFGNEGKSLLHESPLNDNNNLYDNKFFTRSEDPRPYRFVPPADGKYHLLVVCRAGDSVFGPRQTYSVRLSRDETPDFQLVAIGGDDETPDGCNLGQGGREAITVLIDRTETMNEDVELSVEGLPPGVTCPPQILNANVQRTTLVLSATPDAARWAGPIRIKGTATINGQKVIREARSAGIVWPVQPQQNRPTFSRLERGLWLAVRDKIPFALTLSIDKPEILQGDKATLKVKAERRIPDAKNVIQLVLMQPQNRQGSELPRNLRINNNQPFNVNAGANEAGVGVVVGNDVPPGTYNVVLRSQTQIPYNKDAQSKNRPNVFVVQPSSPLTITVLPKSLAQLSLSSGSTNLKIGQQSEIVVRVQRRFNYQGEFKVQLILSKNVTGIEATQVVIPAGQNEAKLVIRAKGDAKPGNRNNLIVQATALFRGKTPTVHETKLNVNVVK